jgi:hypothetical protein
LPAGGKLNNITQISEAGWWFPPENQHMVPENQHMVI